MGSFGSLSSLWVLCYTTQTIKANNMDNNELKNEIIKSYDAELAISIAKAGKEQLNAITSILQDEGVLQTPTIIRGDITEETEGLIIHGVNCQGVMGSGVALAIKTKWPEVYDKYKLHKQGRGTLGAFQPVHIDTGLYVANCWTQEYYGKDGKTYADLGAVSTVLNKAFEFCDLSGLELKAPMIGCGLGGLSWEEEVYPLFKYYSILYPEVVVKIFYI